MSSEFFRTSTRMGAAMGALGWAVIAAGVATPAAAEVLYWTPPMTGSGTPQDPLLLNGNWWDGTTGTDPGDSSYWATSWPSGAGTMPTEPGTLPWTQDSDVRFVNKWPTQYQANMTLYGQIRVNNFDISGAGVRVTITANSESDTLTLSQGGNIATNVTFNTEVIFDDDLVFNGYQMTFNGPLTDGNNGYGLSYTANPNGETGSFNALRLNGVNTYTGTTSITNGQVILGANGSMAASAGIHFTANSVWTVNNFDQIVAIARFNTSAQDGATIQSLSGNGTISAASNNGNGGLIVTGHLTPGTETTAGLLSFVDGDLTVANNVVYDYLIDGSGPSLAMSLIDISGTHDDGNGGTVIENANGTVFFDGNWTLNLDTIGTVDPGQTFVLFQLGSSDLVDLGDWTIDYGSTGWAGGAISQIGDQIVLSNVVIPEPASLMLLGAGAVLVLSRRRSV